MNEPTPLLEIANASKTFDGVTVLDNVAFDVRPGELHALLGQNGSGKSTLIKLLAAFHAPDDGATLTVRGEPVALPMQVDAPRKLGIAFVHQDLGLANDMSIADNLLVGRYQTRAGFRIDWAAERERCRSWLAELGLDVDLRRTPAELSYQAERALLAIARAVAQIRDSHATGVLVLDEPTVYLPRHEVDRLREVTRALTARGVGVIYVTHRLEELPGFADRVTVLRDGRKISTMRMDDVSVGDLIAMILGRSNFLDSSEPGGHVQAGSERPFLSVESLRGERVSDASFQVGRGEVVGVTGLLGMGQEEIPYLVYGASSARGGRILVEGDEVPHPTPRSSLKKGMVLIPSDRPRRAASLSDTVGSNMSLPVVRQRFFRGGRLRRKLELDTMQRLMEEYEVRPANPLHLMRGLSGGNQQKAILAKWLQLEPALVLMDEPTQGIDVGTRRAVLSRILHMAEGGTGVLISSVEYEDLATVCDRVLVFRHGRIAAELAKGSLSKESIATSCYTA